MHEAIHTQDKVSMTLIALLEDHRDEIASSWLDAIQHQQPLLHYGKRPTHEIHTNNLVALDMLLMLIQGHEPDLAWVSHADASLASQYVDLGIEVTEMVTASLLLDEVIDPYIQETFSHDLPRTLSLSRALRRHISTFAQEIVKGYVEASSKHLREQQQRTALMLGITRAVSASLDLDRVLHHVVRGVASAADAQHCILYLVEDDGQAGELWAATEDFPAIIAGRLHELMGRSHPLTQAPSLTRLTLESKRPQTCYDALADPRTNHNFVQSVGIRSILAVPCLLRERAVGVGLVVSLDAYREFTDEQIELALGVANTVAPAIENARLHQRLEQLAVLQERARLAREVHDDLAQSVAHLRMKVDGLQQELASQQLEAVGLGLSSVNQLLSEMSVSIREAIYNLRTPPLPGKKFLPRLRDYLASYRSSYGLSIRLETSIDEEFDISEIVAVQLMRIIQEALSNIRKHAGCTQSWIRLRQNTEHLHVFIEDDGRGLSAARSEDGQKDHYGIQIMKERAGSVGGSVIVKPRPERGTCVCVDVPIDFLPQRH